MEEQNLQEIRDEANKRLAIHEKDWRLIRRPGIRVARATKRYTENWRPSE